MDRHLVALGFDEHDDFEQVGCAIAAKQQSSVGFLADVLGGKRMVDRVEAVVVGYAVLPSRRVDLHAE